MIPLLSVFHCLPDGVIITDLQGKILYVNKAIEVISGYSRLDLIGNSPEILNAEENSAAIQLEILGTIRRNENWKGVLKQRRKDGTIYWGEFEVFPVYDPLGETSAWACLQRDVTERIKLQQELKASEDRYRKLAELSPDIILVHSEGKIKYLNQAGAKFFGTGEPRDYLDREVIDFVHPQYRAEVRERINNASESPEAVPLNEEIYILPDGSTLVGETKSVSINFNAKKSVLTVVRDISERKTAESILNRQKVELQEQLRFAQALTKLAEITIRNDQTGIILDSMTRIIADTIVADLGIVYDVDLKQNKLIMKCQNTEDKESQVLIPPHALNSNEAAASFFRNNKTKLESHLDDNRLERICAQMAKHVHHDLKIQSFYWYPFAFTCRGYYALVLSQFNKPRRFSALEAEFINSALQQVEIAIQKITYVEENKRALQAIKESEENYKDLFENAYDIIFISDLEWKLLSCNKATLKTYGYTAEEISQLNLYQIVHPDYWKLCREKLHAKFSGTATQTGPYPVLTLTKQGAKVWIEVSTRLIYQNGLPVGFQGIARNITERKYMTDALKEAEKEKELILSSISELVVYLDLNMKIKWANSAAAEYSGVRAEDLRGRICYELWRGTSSPCPGCPGITTLKTGIREQKVMTTPDGKSWLIKSFPAFDTEGNLLGMVEIAKDVTEAEQMKKEMARLERLNLIGEMAAGFGHEIRNPMAAVRGFLQILHSKPECLPFAHYFELMIEEIDRANSIIGEYLSLARDKMIDLQEYNLNFLIEAIHPLILADAIHNDQTIELELREIPKVLVDKKEMYQLILNLVRNGLEAMPKGGCLKIKTFSQDNEVIMAIQDQGQGIDPQIINKLGMPFVTTKENGTGLGLAICFSIAQRHKARIEVESTAGGTTFFVKYPSSGLQ